MVSLSANSLDKGNSINKEFVKQENNQSFQGLNGFYAAEQQLQNNNWLFYNLPVYSYPFMSDPYFQNLFDSQTLALWQHRNIGLHKTFHPDYNSHFQMPLFQFHGSSVLLNRCTHNFTNPSTNNFNLMPFVNELQTVFIPFISQPTFMNFNPNEAFFINCNNSINYPINSWPNSVSNEPGPTNQSIPNSILIKNNFSSFNQQTHANMPEKLQLLPDVFISNIFAQKKHLIRKKSQIRVSGKKKVNSRVKENPFFCVGKNHSSKPLLSFEVKPETLQCPKLPSLQGPFIKHNNEQKDQLVVSDKSVPLETKILLTNSYWNADNWKVDKKLLTAMQRCLRRVSLIWKTKLRGKFGFFVRKYSSSKNKDKDFYKQNIDYSHRKQRNFKPR